MAIPGLFKKKKEIVKDPAALDKILNPQTPEILQTKPKTENLLGIDTSKVQMPSDDYSYKPQITFNKDKTVTYSTGENKYELDPEEYSGYLGKGGGILTENVKKLQDEEETLRLRAAMAKEAKLSKKKAEIASQLERDEIIRGAIEKQDIINKIGVLTEEQRNRKIGKKNNLEDAQLAGSMLAGGIAGAAAGSTIPLVGTLGGAVAGSLAAGYKTMASQNIGTLGQANEVFKGAKSNMGWLISQVNSGRIDGSKAVMVFDEELANLLAAESATNQFVRSNINNLLSPQGLEQQIKIETFKRRLSYIEQELARAIARPDPSRVIDLGIDDIKAAAQ